MSRPSSPKGTEKETIDPELEIIALKREKSELAHMLQTAQHEITMLKVMNAELQTTQGRLQNDNARLLRTMNTVWAHNQTLLEQASEKKSEQEQVIHQPTPHRPGTPLPPSLFNHHTARKMDLSSSPSVNNLSKLLEMTDKTEERGGPSLREK